MEIRPSARRHGVADKDILHALRQPLHVEELAESRWLILGPDRAANILEIIIYVTDQGDERIIHAMRATDENLRYL
jgi:hypothetical protein